MGTMCSSYPCLRQAHCISPGGFFFNGGLGSFFFLHLFIEVNIVRITQSVMFGIHQG